MSTDFPQPISEQIWEGKYRLTTPNPDIIDDQNVSETWDRIASACAYAPHRFETGSTLTRMSEVDQAGDNIAFRSILEDFQFLPAGRITAGAGSGRNVTLFNCYVMGTVPDDISGIFEMLREAALTMQQGGGIGYDFSTLRPAGSPVKGVDADASGPLTFMDVWSAMCKTIMSAGYRRGAMMATMRCDHPDIEAFVTAKQDGTRLRMFNMSVLCSNEFMRAVKADEPWDLVHISSPPGPTEIVGQNTDGVALFKHKTIRARGLWERIMDSTYNYAEPGVLFIDVINQANNLWYMEEITSSNPCGEQPLPPYGACLLGSINLTKIVEDPFDHPWINWNRLIRTATIATRMLDCVIDISNFPLVQQQEEAMLKRRMGIGITGLADMLFMMGETYGSNKAAALAEEVMSVITVACYDESIKMAKMYGPCPATLLYKDRASLIQSGFMDNMPDHIKDGILKYGLRNSHLTSIAPTGTISMFAGNVSSGIEPIFAAEYSRKILDDDGIGHRVKVVQDYAVHLRAKFIESGRISEDRYDKLVTAQTLTPADHLKMLTAVQPWVDSSISKTINCPEDISYADFSDIYMHAYDHGLKGCTTYRPNAVTGSVLSLESDKPSKAAVVTKEEPLPLQGGLVEPMERPKILTGTTYKLKWDTRSFYVTMNDYMDDDGNAIPFEIFINSSEMASLQWTVALTRMISAIYRRGGDVAFVGEELKRISDPHGGFWVDKKFVPSFVALLGQTIVNHLESMADNNMLNEEMDPETSGSIIDDIVESMPELKGNMPRQCLECFSFSLVVSSGCETCTACGHSKCG